MDFKKFLSLVAIIHTSSCCFIKAPKLNPRQKSGVFSSLDDRILKRKLADHPCLCGIDNPGEKDDLIYTALDQYWVLYIHVTLSSNETRVCVGTVVNSNMVITSHRCFQKRDRITVADVMRSKVNPSGRNPDSSLASVEDIILANDYDLAYENLRKFTVKKIIYSERFAYDSVYELAPDSDIAILVVDHDFTIQTNDSMIQPICIPRFGQLNTKDLLNRDAHYQGIRHYMNDYRYVGIFNFSTIRTAEDCNNGAHLGVKPSSNETLCLMFTQPGPTIEGGPIRINKKRPIEGGPRRSFLVGIATWVERTIKNAGHNYAYFTNINTIAKYIEYQADLHHSTWCPSPNPDDKHWPWEEYTGEVTGTLDCKCGFQKEDSTGRIAGGEEAEYNEFPWLVKFNISIPENNETELCGGSVINDRMLMTAAHCVVRNDVLENATVDPKDFNVAKAAGQPELHGIFLHSKYYHENEDKSKKVSVYQVHAKQVIIHPGYPDERRENRFDYDIALIVLAEPLTLGKRTPKHLRIDPICLPKKGYLEGITGQNATIAGWGSTIAGVKDFFATALKKLNVPIRPLAECGKVDREIGNLFTYPTDTILCATWNNENENVGPGDSGGPLMHKTGKNKFTQVGITSFIVNHEKGNTYFSNVEAFLPFINYYSKENDAQFCKN